MDLPPAKFLFRYNLKANSHTWENFWWLKLFKSDQKLFLKANSQIWEFFLVTESSLKIMKNYSYLTLKALFVLKLFKFLSWLFGNVEKKLD